MQTTLAKAAVSSTLSQPLLSSSSTSEAERYEDEHGGDDENKKKWFRAPTGRETIALTVSCVSLAAQGIAFGLYKSILVRVAAGFGAATSPFCTVQQVRLTNQDTLRGLINEINMEVNRLSEQNDQLTLEIDDLEVQVDKVKEVEVKLSGHAAELGKSTNELVELVKENEETLKELRKCVKAVTMQDVVHLVLASDRDMNFRFSDRELLELSMRIVQQLEAHDIEMDIGILMAPIRLNPTVSGVLNTVKRLLEEDEDDKKRDKNSLNIKIGSGRRLQSPPSSP